MSDPLAEHVTLLLPGVASPTYLGSYVSYGTPRAFVAPYGTPPEFALGDSARPLRAGSLRMNRTGADGVRGLTLPPAFSPTGRQAFCVEAYAKLTAAPTYQNLFNTCGSNTGGNCSLIYDPSVAKWVIALYDGSRPSAAAAVTSDLNAWQHLALVRNDSDVFRLFIDGFRVAEFTYAISLNSAAAGIGYNPSYAPMNFYGNIHDFRITLGDSRYWDDFTPPDPFEFAEGGFNLLCGRTYRQAGFALPAFSGLKKSARHYVNSSQKSVGTGSIVGTVKEKASPANLPLARRVALFRHADDQKVAEGWSDTAGNYAFANVDPRLNYYVVAFDHTGTYRAVVADNLTPTLS